MTLREDDIDAPFSRIIRVDTLPRNGETMVIEANAEERAALAALLKVPAIERLAATLTVKRAARGGARVVGAVHGALTQTCIVTLEPFPAEVEEDVDVLFAPPEDSARKRGPAEELEISMLDDDEPDPLVDGRIDLGALAAEFFALGLDPYPRKPGVEFTPPEDEPDAPEPSPFSVLRDAAKKPD